jgi:hypothetical protein
MRRVSENRTAVLTERRVEPDPRNVGRVARTNPTTGRLEYHEVDYGDRSAFEGEAIAGPAGSVFVQGRTRFPDGAFTVNEVAARGLTDVDVIVPRKIAEGGFVRYVPGNVVPWAEAVRVGLVDDGGLL